MDFEEKIDAMRTTLELAIHDIEAKRAGMQEMHAAMQEVRISIEELRLLSAHQHESIQELRMMSEHQRESMQDLMKISGQLVQAATLHDRRIGAIEGRLNG